MEQPPFFNFGNPDNRPPVTIRTRGRNMLLRTLDGTMAHVPAGTEITIAAETLDRLSAEDVEMETTAMRIRARAVRRCGELLKEVEKASGKNNQYAQVKKADSVPFQETRQQAAADAGMSKRQAVTARA